MDTELRNLPEEHNHIQNKISEKVSVTLHNTSETLVKRRKFLFSAASS